MPEMETRLVGMLRLYFNCGGKAESDGGAVIDSDRFDRLLVHHLCLVLDDRDAVSLLTAVAVSPMLLISLYLACLMFHPGSPPLLLITTKSISNVPGALASSS
jgi:hypothetical protein